MTWNLDFEHHVIDRFLIFICRSRRKKETCDVYDVNIFSRDKDFNTNNATSRRCNTIFLFLNIGSLAASISGRRFPRERVNDNRLYNRARCLRALLTPLVHRYRCTWRIGRVSERSAPSTISLWRLAGRTIDPDRWY